MEQKTAVIRWQRLKEGLQEKKSLSYFLDLASIKELFFYIKKMESVSVLRC